MAIAICTARKCQVPGFSRLVYERLKSFRSRLTLEALGCLYLWLRARRAAPIIERALPLKKPDVALSILRSSSSLKLAILKLYFL